MRPGGLTAVCVIAFVLAAFGLFALLSGCAGLFLQQFFVDMMSSMQQAMPMPPGPQGQQMQAQLDAQANMFQEIAAMQRRYLPLIIAQLSLHLVVVVLLVTAGIRALQLKPRAHTLVIVAMLVLIVFVLARTYPQVAVQVETEKITMRYMDEIMQAQPNPAAARAMRGSMQSMTKMGTAFGLAFWGAWSLLVISYAGTSIWYVNQPQIRSLFAEAGHPDADPSAVDPSLPESR